MTTAGSTRPAHGTRYEFVLVESDGNARAVYEARVFRAEFEARLPRETSAPASEMPAARGIRSVALERRI